MSDRTSSDGPVATEREDRTRGIFCEHDAVGLRGAATGVLAGRLFAVKDVIQVRGVRACYGNPTWLATHGRAERTAPCVQALLDAGASLIGVTLTDELALSLTGENAHYGTPPNPACPDRVPGGSSAGSAAAVALGIVPFALGTDTGGSVRVPASHTGIFGFRPTHGAVNAEGVLPLAPRFDTVGWFARDARVLEKVGQVLVPPSSPSPPPERLVVWDALSEFVDPGAWTAFMEAATGLGAALGLPIVREAPAHAPALDTWVGTYLTLQNLEAKAHHAAFIEHEKPVFGSLIGRRFQGVLATSEAAAPEAEARRTALGLALASVHESRAWMLLPTAPGAAPLRGLPDDAIDAFTGRGLTLASIASLCGAPQVSLPLSRAEGCPLGVSLLGPRGADAALLAAARRAAAHLALNPPTERS